MDSSAAREGGCEVCCVAVGRLMPVRPEYGCLPGSRDAEGTSADRRAEYIREWAASWITSRIDPVRSVSGRFEDGVVTRSCSIRALQTPPDAHVRDPTQHLDEANCVGASKDAAFARGEPSVGTRADPRRRCARRNCDPCAGTSSIPA